MKADKGQTSQQRRRAIAKWNAWPIEMRPRWPDKKRVAAIDEEKVSDAAEACWRRCSDTERPFHELSRSLESYKKDPEWTHAEIKELRSRVVRILMANS